MPSRRRVFDSEAGDPPRLRRAPMSDDDERRQEAQEARDDATDTYVELDLVHADDCAGEPCTCSPDVERVRRPRPTAGRGDLKGPAS